MIKVENIETWGFEHAVRGMRNPKNSWDKSDSNASNLGKQDLGLMYALYRSGSEHRKFARQIFISMDITAPLYWWKEMDTYKIGTVSDSCSTMHKIHSKEFTLDDFSHEHLINENVNDGTEYLGRLLSIINDLNTAREEFINTKDKIYWWQMIQLLPSSYNQKRTITMNYENAFNIINQRKYHKLDEWVEFTKILRTLPYLETIMGED